VALVQIQYKEPMLLAGSLLAQGLEQKTPNDSFINVSCKKCFTNYSELRVTSSKQTSSVRI